MNIHLDSKPDIWVGNEWGELKEVIIGRPEQMTYPTMIPLFKERLNIFDKAEHNIFLENSNKTFKEVNEERYNKMCSEVENWVTLLENRGIKVYRPRLLNEDELSYQGYLQKGVGSIFTKDPLIVVGNIVIEGSNRVPSRRKDVFGYRHIMEERVLGSNAKWFSIPTSMPDSNSLDGGKGPFLTGGDVFPLGNKNVLLGYNGVDSNMLGLQWIASILKSEGWKVHFVEYSPEVMHLDCCFSAPREGVALICRNAFPKGLPDIIKKWDMVSVTIPEAKIDACNGLPLGNGVYAMSTEFEYIGDKVEKKGIEVIYTDMTETNHLTGGGMRCSHGPLVRKD